MHHENNAYNTAVSEEKDVRRHKKRRKDFTKTFKMIGFRVVFFSMFQDVDNKANTTFIMKNREKQALSFYARGILMGFCYNTDLRST